MPSLTCCIVQSYHHPAEDKNLAVGWEPQCFTLILTTDRKSKVIAFFFAYDKYVQTFPHNCWIKHHWGCETQIHLLLLSFSWFSEKKLALTGAMDQEAPASCPKPNAQLTLPVRLH